MSASCSHLLAADATAALGMADQLLILDRYAAHLGIPRRQRRADADIMNGEPLWDGRALIALDRPEDLAHELAHWLVATPAERRQVNYGWSFDWQWLGPGSWPRQRGEKRKPDDETRACLLGFAMLARLGFRRLNGLYVDYGFYTEDDAGHGILCPSAVRARAAVQPLVEPFTAWLKALL